MIVTGSLAFYVLIATSCNIAFRKNGKLITNRCLRAANNLRWCGWITSYLPSQVMYLCITPANSFHGSLRALGLSPFPFLSSSSPGSAKDSTTSLSVVYFPVHCMPVLGRPVTSAMISSVTGIRISQTMETPPCKFWNNSSVIFVSYPCN
jgi:hypothetical protein